MTDLVTNRQKLSNPVDHSDERDHKDVANQLIESLNEIGGYGLSANQIGIYDSRTCLISVKQNIVFINPTVVNKKRKTTLTESCLSLPGESVRTERNVWVEVKADAWMVESVGEWNEIGGSLEFGPEFWKQHQENNQNAKYGNEKYMESIAVQHEIDHLNGKTIFDRQSKQQPFEKSELESLGRNDKVFVRNEKGEEFDVKWKYAKKNDDWMVLAISDT